MLKVWIWLKNYWYIPFIVIIAIVLGIFLRRENNVAMQLLNNAIESYKKQIAEIERLNQEKEKQKEELEKKYNLVLQQIEEKYKKDNEQLTVDEKKRVKELVKQYEGDDEMMSVAFASEFGLRLGE